MVQCLTFPVEIDGCGSQHEPRHVRDDRVAIVTVKDRAEVIQVHHEAHLRPRVG